MANTLENTAIAEEFNAFAQNSRITERTQKALKKLNFVTPTLIQQKTLDFALDNHDLMACAQTGSGKTLAFLIPTLEVLLAENWNAFDGLGALVISPTRELAIQIFQELRKVGQFHDFSAGLLIGGKNLAMEQERVGKMNILICTPGRLLQHLDTSPEFNVGNLKMLVLDEADAILDQGFKRDVDAILQHLPNDRQTMLFSATQTKSIMELARLSLKNPKFVNVHNEMETSTPANLVQKFIKTTLETKLNVLFSFIKAHNHKKILVFLSSCKQVRFVFETFCKLQPGVSLSHLHGKQKLDKRMHVFKDFCKRSEACLFATDVAARGLDFPGIDWVIQVDCPADVDSYIHRVGRTARYNTAGQSLLILLPSELEMVSQLVANKVPIQEIKLNPKKTMNISTQISGIVASSTDLKYLAQRAFVCYLRSVHLQGNKEVFDVAKLPVDLFADSLGLPGAPKIKFKKKNAAKNASRQIKNLDNTKIPLMDTPKDDDDDEQEPEKQKKQNSKIDKMFEKKNTGVLSAHYQNMISHVHDDESSDEDFVKLLRKDHELDDSIPAPTALKKKKSKKQLAKESAHGKRFVFDEDGNKLDAFSFQSTQDFDLLDKAALREDFVNEKREQMMLADETDKKVQKEKRKALKDGKKYKEKAARRLESGPNEGVILDAPKNNENEYNENAKNVDSDYQSDSLPSNSDYEGQIASDMSDQMESDEEQPQTKTRRQLDGLQTSALEELALQFLHQ